MSSKPIDTRIAKFESRRNELKALSDEQLKVKFWELCNQVVSPIVDLAKTHTSPSIERSVLLRMGIDSVTTHGVVKQICEAGLLGKGAGNCLLKLSKKLKMDLGSTAQAVLKDKNLLNGLF